MPGKRKCSRDPLTAGTSFSEEVGEAVDFYLEMPADTREELKALAVEANCAADRIIHRLDGTIAHVDAVLSEMNSPRRQDGLAGNAKK
jgi:hypothetical protein